MRNGLLSLFLVFSCISLTVPAKGEPLSKVFQRVNPSVVLILTRERGYTTMIRGEGVATQGLASGVVISEDGLIMTAAHVVQVADEVNVSFADGAMVSAKVVNSAPQADVALLKLESQPSNLIVAHLGDSNKVHIGDRVFVVGAPYGMEHTLTVGYLSGRRRPLGACPGLLPIEFLQTDAAINRGNSGGPMFNMDGEVIAIVSRILSQSGGSEGLGFAVSINTARELLLEQKSFWSGLQFYVVSGPLAKALNVPQEAGLLIQRVATDSPGYRLGLQPGNIPVRLGNEKLLLGGDIILEVQGIAVSTDEQTGCEIRQRIGGLSRFEVKVLRAGKILRLSTPIKGRQ